MNKRFVACALAAALCLNLTACAAKQSAAGSTGVADTANSQTTPAGGQTAAAENRRPTFLTGAADTAQDVTPAVEPYTVDDDFGNVINYERYQYLLSDEAKEMLRKNGFVVSGGWGNEFFTTYEMQRYNYLPNFVTTDSMMHTYHLYFARLLKGVEKDAFCDDLIEIGTQMQTAALEEYEALKGSEWENAALRNVAFFTVGLALMQPDADIPAPVADVVGQELALIDAANTIADSPIMNLGGADAALGSLQEDYTQYIPRSYYAEDETLSRYFKAMMWYGRLSFRQKDADQSRSALLMTLALNNSDAMKKWEEIYNITSFFVGTSDDPGVYEYTPLIEQSYGSLPAVADLAGNTAAFDAFAAAAAALPAPAINSIPIYDESITPDRDSAISAFRFMGQRATLDASIFQKLIYRDVDANSAGDLRMLPSALDLPSALGSNSAQQILRNEGAEDYEKYPENMQKVREGLEQAPVGLWSNSLYMGWVNTLRPLLLTKGEGWPQFMQNAAWETKGLNTFVSSWTELKHDAVLYAKQNYAEMGGGPVDVVDDRGYVEPEYQLYDRLALLCGATADGLNGYGVLNDTDAENLALLKSLAEQLAAISRKELQNEGLTEDEYELIRTYGGQLEHFWESALTDANGNPPEYSQWYPAAIVTDIATDPNGTVLEVGTGAVDEILVIVNVEGSLRIASGGVYSFYQFEQPMDQRLTDAEWRLMLGVDWDPEETQEVIPPERPIWVGMFRTPAPWE